MIDPVFLGELEHLIQDISCCQLELKLSTDLWPDRPSDCVPSIFRRRKIQTPTKRRKDSSGKVTKRAKAQKQGSQQQQAEVAILDLTESDEQRLPLKKRHHHLQAEGKEGKGVAECVWPAGEGREGVKVFPAIVDKRRKNVKIRFVKTLVEEPF